MAPSATVDSTIKVPYSSIISFPATPSEGSAGDDGVEEHMLETIRGQAFVVDWQGIGDKGNPQNLPGARKWVITISLALYALTTTFSSSVFGAAGVVMAREFHQPVSKMMLGCNSLFMVGFATGPTLWGPLSECFGRRRPLMLAYLAFAILQLPVLDARRPATVFVLRFLQGFFGVAPSSILSGVLADIWSPKQRGFAVPTVGCFLTIGPIFGPLIGSILVNGPLGWRWISTVTALASLAVAAITFPVLPETYSPLLLSRRAKRLRLMTQNWAYRSKWDETESDLSDFTERYLLRPLRMVILEPILLCMTLYISVSFGLLYNFFIAYPTSFIEERGWDQTTASLPLISVLVGVILAGALISFTTNTRLSPNPQAGRPQETRLILMMLGAICLPVGIFWFAFTSDAVASPWPQILAGVPSGLGITLINMQGMNYIVDSYTIYANSALAANTCARSLFAAFLPIVARIMYMAIGVKKGTMLLGFLAVALAPVPLLFYVYGARIRARSRWVPPT